VALAEAVRSYDSPGSGGGALPCTDRCDGREKKRKRRPRVSGFDDGRQGGSTGGPCQGGDQVAPCMPWLCYSSTSPSVFISWSRFRNYETPKIVNKLENLQKQKLQRSYRSTTFPKGVICFDQRFVWERRPKLPFLHGSSYCSQRIQLDFWPICTQNWNVHQLQKMCSRK
jgi:hypothetical protein